MKKINYGFLAAALFSLAIFGLAWTQSGARAKTKATMTLNLSKEVVAGELQVKMSGSITPAKSGVKVNLSRKLFGRKSFRRIATVRTDVNGEYSYYSAFDAGAKSIRAVAKTSGRDPKKTVSYNLDSMTLAGITILSPHMSDGDIDNIPEAFSTTAAGPWGFAHTGIDFIPTRDLVPFQAVIDGEIVNSSCAEESLPMGWHCGFGIEQGEFSAYYNFEAFSDSEEVGARQIANIFVSDGDNINAGDIMGYLVQGGDSAHLDFGVIPSTGASRSCPQPYFTTDAHDSIMGLIHADHPTWEMCYE